jgi:alpha-methylacyl-CoA racemase
MNGGPLTGVRIIELAGLGPAPFAAMLLADLGADVIRVDRVGLGRGDAQTRTARSNVINRGKRSVAVDLKTAEGREFVLRLVETADALLEGFRPGVAERLGVGPEDCAARNAKLVYGRMTGFGQDGPLAQVAGHDIGYVALTGALWATGRTDERPTPALNLVGDYAGGSMFLVVGVLAALLERRHSGRGQVVDAAMVDGTSALTTMFTAMSAMGRWDLTRRGSNLLDTGAPYYEVYECADGRFISVGAIEPQFYADLVRLTGFRSDLPDVQRLQQPSPHEWSESKAEWAALWRTRTRDEWADLLSSTDACVQPVLDWAEARSHPHLKWRNTFVERDGIGQPAPAPRLSRTPGTVSRLPPLPGEHTVELARELGWSDAEVQRLLELGAVAGRNP